MRQKISRRFIHLCGAALFLAVLACSAFVAPFASAKATRPNFGPYYPHATFSSSTSKSCATYGSWFHHVDALGYSEMATHSSGSIICSSADWIIDPSWGDSFYAWLWVPTHYANTNICFGFYSAATGLKEGVGCVNEASYGDQWAQIKPQNGATLNYHTGEIRMSSNDGSTTTWIGIGCAGEITIAFTWWNQPAPLSKSSC